MISTKRVAAALQRAIIDHDMPRRQPSRAKSSCIDGTEGNSPVLTRWLRGLRKDKKVYALISRCDGTHAARIAVQEEIGRPDIVVIMECDIDKRAIVCEKFGYPNVLQQWHLTKDGVLVCVLADV